MALFVGQLSLEVDSYKTTLLWSTRKNGLEHGFVQSLGSDGDVDDFAIKALPAGHRKLPELHEEDARSDEGRFQLGERGVEAWVVLDGEAVFLAHGWHPVLLEVPFAGGAEPGLFAFSDVNLEVIINEGLGFLLFMCFVVFWFCLVIILDFVIIKACVQDVRGLEFDVGHDLFRELDDAGLEERPVAAAADEDGAVHVVQDKVVVPLLGCEWFLAVFLFLFFGCVFETILIISTLLGFGFGLAFPFGFKEAILILSALLGFMHGPFFPEPVFFKGCFESL